MSTCHDCGGDGIAGRNDEQDPEMICPTCRGTGEIPDERSPE